MQMYKIWTCFEVYSFISFIKEIEGFEKAEIIEKSFG
jgi:hypothetical protein